MRHLTSDDLQGLPDTARHEIESLRAEVARLNAVVDAQRAAIRDLRRDVVRDPLTGLLNRRGFRKVLDRTVDFVRRYQQSVSLIFIDLDQFKDVNDTHGHAAGDAALMHVAKLLTGTLRRSDIIGRIGGDEFVALLWKADEVLARDTAARVADALRRTPLPHDGVQIPLRASLGVAALQAGDAAAAVLGRADADMYRAKASRTD